MRATSSRVLGAVLVMPAFAIAQQMIWVPVANTGPAPRTDHAISYDAQRGRTVLFGGASTNDTWEWDGSTWLQTSPGSSPPARSGHAMAYDSMRGRTVMFGGYPSGGGGQVGDTWEWDGVVWTHVATIGPSARSLHAMAYDSARGRTVLFGGAGIGGHLGDTWEWDGSTWTSMSASGPSPRSRHAMVYDSQRARVVLFGGWVGSSALLGDTWEWDGVTWAPRGGGPSARRDHAMAYDSAHGRTVMCGGGATLPPSNDTWEWDGLTWFQVATTGPNSFALFGRQIAMAFDSGVNGTVLFGGFTTAGVQGDTWVWIDPPPGTASTFGTGCGTPALQLSPDTTNVPTIGTPAQAFLTNVPSSFAFVALGWSNTNAGPFLLPVPLDGYGMIGCFMRQSTELLAAPTTSTGLGSASYTLALPLLPSLIGVHLYLQGWAVAPGMNPAGIIVSNGLDWQFGY